MDPARTKLDILAIDGSAADRSLLERSLRMVLGPDLIFRSAASWEQARDLLNADIALVFVAYELGARNALSVIRELRTAGHQQGVIALCARDDGRLAASLIRSGADDFLCTAQLEPRLLQQSMTIALRSRASRDARRADARELQRLVGLDELTGIPNRRSFDDRLTREWRRHQRSGQPLSVAILDIDHFKRFNDSAGHQQGDACLRSVAETLAASCHRPDDFLARYGGEEFAVLMPETDQAGAVIVVERMVRNLHHLAIPHPDSPTAPVVTLSAGLCCSQAEPRSPGGLHRLIYEADAALYRAKEAGRNRLVTAGP